MNGFLSRRLLLSWRPLSVRQSRTVSQRSSHTSQAESITETVSSVREFSDVPGPKGLPVLGNLLDYYDKGFKFQKAFKVQASMFKKYGPIYKDSLINLERVNIIDPKDMEEVFRADGKYPDRPGLDVWAEHRKRRGYPLGVTQMFGDEWARVRKSFATKMLRPLDIQDNMENLNHVNNDVLTRLRTVRAENGEIPNLSFELFRWSTESIGTFVFDARLGLLDDPPREEPMRFIEATQDFFKYTQELLFAPPFYKMFDTPAWKGFCKASDLVIEMGSKYVEEKTKQLAEKSASDDHASDGRVSFLEHMLTKGDLTAQEVVIQATELLMGGVDTAAQTFQWTLYLLARNHEVQQKVFTEISSVLKADEAITASHLKRVPFLKAAIKEAMRLYPVAFVNARILQKDLVLGEYLIPAGTFVQLCLYTQARSEEYFEDACQFKPERWLRDGREQPRPFSSQPFGSGPRMCPGRRVAELEMHMFLAKIIRNFKLDCQQQDMEPTLRLVVTPEEPLRIKFEERQ